MSKGDQTRDEILHHALGEASRLGLEGLSIGDLAKGVGMSKSGLFAHFGSKEGLQIAVLQRASDLFGEAVIRPAVGLPRGLPRLQAITENWVNWADSNVIPGGCLFMSATFEYDDRPGPIRDTIVVHLGTLLANLSRATRVAIEAGHLRADLDPDAFAFQWHSLLLGYHVQSRLFRNPNSRPLLFASFEALVQSVRPSST